MYRLTPRARQARGGRPLEKCWEAGCPVVKAEVLHLDPASLLYSPVLSYPGRARVSIATAALQVNDEIWVSSDFFNRIVRIPVRDDLAQSNPARRRTSK